MQIHIVDKEQQSEIYDAVLEMLAAADRDFVPPLSARNSSTQQDFSQPAKNNQGVLAYFEQLKSQRFAAVYENGQLIAFVSYKENYTCPHIPQNALPNIYLSTLIVRPEARGKGVTTALYRQLFDHYRDRYIFTRTWSQNLAHIRVLEKYGFSLIKTLPHDRGEGIHTVYFQKNPQPDARPLIP